MKRSALVVLIVLAGACGSVAGETPTTTAVVYTGPSTYATTAPTEASTTTVLTTTGTTDPSQSTTTSTTTPTVSTTPSEIVPFPTLADGRPTTWLGVTSEYEAVEVSTATGALVHTFGQTGTRDLIGNTDGPSPNVISAIYRLRDGSTIGLIDCCEPAGGVIHYVPAQGTLGENPSAADGTDGWTLAASPTNREFARLGYALSVFDPTTPAADRVLVFVDEPEFGFPSGQVAWSVDGQALYWIGIEFGGGPTTLNRLDVSTNDSTPVVVGTLDFVGQDQFLGNIATQVSGNIVGFLHTEGDGIVTATEGVVFNPEGDLLSTFEVEAGSLLGTYDASGRYLIYVGADGIVRWIGGGESGELGAGYIHASW